MGIIMIPQIGQNASGEVGEKKKQMGGILVDLPKNEVKKERLGGRPQPRAGGDAHWSWHKMMSKSWRNELCPSYNWAMSHKGCPDAHCIIETYYSLNNSLTKHIFPQSKAFSFRSFLFH